MDWDYWSLLSSRRQPDQRNLCLVHGSWIGRGGTLPSSSSQTARQAKQFAKANMTRQCWNDMSDHFGNLGPCNVWRLPGWANLIVERRLNLHHWIFWNMSVKTVLIHPLWVPCISGLLVKLHYKRGTEKSIKTFFFFLQLKPKLVLRSRGVWNIDKTFGNPDVCQNIWVMLD